MGAKYLIPWKNVFKPKKFGGLGIKNLQFQNNCLLMKFSFKLLQRPDLPWVNWYHQNYSHNIADKPSKLSFLQKVVNQQLPTLTFSYFVITYSCTATFFWLDTRLLQVPLQLAFPHLFSHTINDNVQVATVWQTGILSNLGNRLTNAASRALDAVFSLLQDFPSSNRQDECSLIHGLPFSAKNAYNIFMAEDNVDLNYNFIWSSKATIKVKIFGWLFFRDRLNTKANMHHKHIADLAACPRSKILAKMLFTLFASAPLQHRFGCRLFFLLQRTRLPFKTLDHQVG